MKNSDGLKLERPGDSISFSVNRIIGELCREVSHWELVGPKLENAARQFPRRDGATIERPISNDENALLG